MTSDLSWDEDGAPRSQRFGDVYFSKDGGLAEARSVFLEGCGLPHAWYGRRRFTVGELGFGTGLNIAALLELWRRTHEPGARLSVFSVEAYPLEAGEAARALALHPEVAGAAAALTSAWPGKASGFHRLDLDAYAATLDLAVMDAEAALGQWRGAADAWFLDGFAPARNPAMWAPAVLAGVAARSAPGAAAATYSVAGAVRRGLHAAGFAVERHPGFGRKRERLQARLPGAPAAEGASPRIAIVGAGIAGASLARAFAALGAAPLVFDADGPGAGASGNSAALVTPRLDAGLGPSAALFAQGFARAIQLYGAAPQALIARGALQLQRAPRDARRFDVIAAADLFEPGRMRRLSAAEASAVLGEAAPGGLSLRDALVVDPAVLLARWLPPVRRAAVSALARAGGAWRLSDQDGASLADVDIVCLASGAAAATLAPEAPLSPVRGQASQVKGLASAAAAFGAYVIPTRDGVLFGATYDRGDSACDIRGGDNARNLASLAAVLPELAGRLAGSPIAARAAVRATTPDRLPVAGALGDGRFILGGLGSRGFTLAPLLAEHVAALALGAPSPLPTALAELVAPDRFARHAVTRVSGRNRSAGVDLPHGG